MSATKKPKGEENPIVLKSEDDKPLNLGELHEVTEEENPPKEAEKSEDIDQIDDISAELNAQIAKASKAEKQKQLNDELLQEEDEEEYLPQNKKSHKALFILGTVFLIGTGAYFYFKHRTPEHNIKEALDNLEKGESFEVITDEYGIIQKIDGKNI